MNCESCSYDCHRATAGTARDRRAIRRPGRCGADQGRGQFPPLGMCTIVPECHPPDHCPKRWAMQLLASAVGPQVSRGQTRAASACTTWLNLRPVRALQPGQRTILHRGASLGQTPRTAAMPNSSPSRSGAWYICRLKSRLNTPRSSPRARRRHRFMHCAKPGCSPARPLRRGRINMSAIQLARGFGALVVHAARSTGQTTAAQFGAIPTQSIPLPRSCAWLRGRRGCN